MNSLIFAIFAILAAPQPPPDVSGWTMLGQPVALEVRANDLTTIFIGVVTDYVNPDCANEMVRVFSRHLVVTSLRSQKSNQGLYDEMVREASRMRHKTDEEKALDVVRQSMDNFAFVRWSVSADSSGQERLAGEVESWLLDRDGQWQYGLGEQVLTQTVLTEPWMLTPSRRVVVGIIFGLGDTTQILRVNQGTLIFLVKPEKANAK